MPGMPGANAGAAGTMPGAMPGAKAELMELCLEQWELSGAAGTMPGMGAPLAAGRYVLKQWLEENAAGGMGAERSNAWNKWSWNGAMPGAKGAPWRNV